jgi:hypothetical protein
MLRKEENRLIAPASMRLGNGEGAKDVGRSVVRYMYIESQGSQYL